MKGVRFMDIKEKNLFEYLSPQEQQIFKRIKEREQQNYAIIPALYRVKNLTSIGIDLKKQIEADKEVLEVLKKKARMRKAKEISLSRKIDDEKYEALKQKFTTQ